MDDMDMGDMEGEDGMPGGCCAKMSVKKMAPWKDMTTMLCSLCCCHCVGAPSQFAIIPCNMLCECCCCQFKCPIKINAECAGAVASMDPEQMVEHCPIPKCGTDGPGGSPCCRGACRSFCCAALWECPCKAVAPCAFGILGVFCKPGGCCPDLIATQKEAFGSSPFEKAKKKKKSAKKKAAGGKKKGKGKKKKDKEDEDDDDDDEDEDDKDDDEDDDDDDEDDGGDDEE